ncbi:MAG TPA: enoyl-CoA hydratase-related protein, partial [Alphaproteobacteria bacterium]|nr:enoyl-CoA hydratase-related protein [Alphaproteobacteria bacterium]
MIDYAVDGDGIATIAWNVANRPMNVMNAESLEAFGAAVEKAIGDNAVKGVIITSARKEFLVGADLAAMQGKATAEDLHGFVWPIHMLFRRMETSGKPFAAAINGHALGGGYETCLACHYRVAADDPKLKIGLPEAKVGLLPGAGGTQRLPRLIGIRETLPLLLEGRELSPQAAAKLGMVHKLVPAGELLAEAKRWLLEEGQQKGAAVQPWDSKGFKLPGGAVQSPAGQQAFVAGNAMLHARTFGNYPGPQNIMSCVYEGCIVDIDTAIRIETRYFINTALRPESKNLIRFFFSMTDANKGGRRPEGVAKAKLATVGVLGAGMMGAGIAYATAMAGLDVVLLDTSLEAAEKGKGYSKGLLDKRVARKRM